MENPCSEIIASRTQGVVQPWVQIHWMNHFRVKQGLPPFTVQEIEEELRKLEAQIADEPIKINVKGVQTGRFQSEKPNE